jgi:WD40 repeat protein/uncharacterized caspase-like protein
MKPRLKLTSCILLLLLTSAAAYAQKPELVEQTGHTNTVTSVAFSPDGKLLAAADLENTVKLWDVSSGKVTRTLVKRAGVIEPDGSINSLAFSPDGKTLVSAGYRSIQLWDIATGQARTLEKFDIISYSFALSPDGKVVAAGLQDSTIKLWEVATGRELHTLSGHVDMITSVAFSPDGQTLASGGFFNDKSIRLWDVTTGQLIRVLYGATTGVSSIAFSPNGETLVSTGDVNNGINWWDVASGRELKTIYGHEGFIASVKFSPDGKLIASAGGGEKGAVKLWDVATGRVLQSYPRVSQCVEFSPDGKTLASGGGTFDTSMWWAQKHNVRLWDVATGRELKTLTGRFGGAYGVTSSADGKTLVLASGRDIKLWNIASGQALKTLSGHTASVYALALSADGKILASGGQDKVVKLWDIASGQELKSLEGINNFLTSLYFSPDGKTLIASQEGDPATYNGMTVTTTLGGTVRLWDVASGRVVKSYQDYDPVGLSANRWVLASTSKDSQGREDNSIKILNVVTGEQSVLKGHTARILTAAFSPDGKMLASSSDDQTIRLWDLSTGREARVARTGLSPSRLAFSSDGRMLVVGGRETNVFKLLDVATGGEVRSLQLTEPSAARELFTVAPDFFRNHLGHVVTPDGKFRISLAENGKLNLYDFETGELLARLIALDGSDWAIVTPGGLFDGTPAAWEELIWRLDDNTFDYAPVEAFFDEFFYPGLLADILAGRRPEAPQSIAEKDIRQPQVRLSVGGPTTVAAPYTVVSLEVAEEGPTPKHPRTGSGARDMRLFRNGALVKLWAGDAFTLGAADGCGQRRSGKVVCEVQVPLVAGENRITAYAFNSDNVKSRSAELPQPIVGADSLKRGSTMYVLAVGVNRYKDENLNLKLAVKDAEGFGARVEAEQKGLGNYERTVVVTLRDGEATKANVMHALRQLMTREKLPLPAGAPAELEKISYANAGDAVVVYFAGHGVAEGERFYLLPQEFGAGGRRGAEELAAHGISDEELERAFEPIVAGKLLMVIDACNSGQALGREKAGRGPMNSKGLAQLAYDKGMYILTAAQSQQAALEVSELGHGLLTYVLVKEGLEQSKAEANGDGQIVGREWLDYATGRVPQMQVGKMKQCRDVKRECAVVEGEEQIKDIEKRSLQMPRVFYRRELEAQPLVVARPGAGASGLPSK